MKNRKIAPWFTLLALTSLTACSSNRSITRMPDSTPQPASATTWKLHYEIGAQNPNAVWEDTALLFRKMALSKQGRGQTKKSGMVT